MFEILLVEDNPADVVLVREALWETETPHNLTVASDADEATALLSDEGRYARSTRPDIVLLDINLPGRSGHEVLKELKSSDAFKAVPVIVFTSSVSETDIRQAYAGHANSYVQKPHDLAGYFDLFAHLGAFWFRLSRLPGTLQ